MRAYGVLIALIFASMLLSLGIHDDLLIIKAHRFDWIAGDLILVGFVVWGICFTLATFKQVERLFRYVGLLFSLLCTALVVYVNLVESRSVWPGLSLVLVLFFAPSLVAVLALRRNPGDWVNRV